jgi:hypothetical protein
LSCPHRGARRRLWAPEEAASMMNYGGGNPYGNYGAQPVQQQHGQNYIQQNHNYQPSYQQNFQQHHTQPEQYKDPAAELDKVVNATKNQRDGARSCPRPSFPDSNSAGSRCARWSRAGNASPQIPRASLRHLAPEQRCAVPRVCPCPRHVSLNIRTLPSTNVDLLPGGETGV